MPSYAILSGIIVRLRNLTDIKCMLDPVFPAVDIYRRKFQPDCLRTTADCSLTLGLRNVYQRFHQSTFSFFLIQNGSLCNENIKRKTREKKVISWNAVRWPKEEGRQIWRHGFKRQRRRWNQRPKQREEISKDDPKRIAVESTTWIQKVWVRSGLANDGRGNCPAAMGGCF